MSNDTMNIGDRIYYTGDMANHEGKGTIVAIRPANKWAGMSYDIKIDGLDAREFKGVFPYSFAAGCGRRFWALQEWEDNQQMKIETMQREWAAQRMDAEA